MFRCDPFRPTAIDLVTSRAGKNLHFRPRILPETWQHCKKVSIRAIDMFSGGGGSSWGALQAGVEIVAAFDCWPLAAKTHKTNFPNTEFFRGKLENRNLRQLKKKLGRINLILASPECTSHSPAKGSKPRCEKSKNTAFQVIRFAKALRPRWIVIENVVSMRKWTRYAGFKAALEKLGYNLREQILNSVHFGVPQSRRRLFLIADKQQTPPRIMRRKTEPKKVGDIVDLNETYRWTPLRRLKRANATLERAERGFAALGKSKPFLIVYYGSDGGGGWQRLNRPLRTITTVDRFALVRPDRNHGHVMRMLQVPELKAAMGMPLRMKLKSGTRRDRIKMIGNAVCPPVMRVVVSQLIAANLRGQARGSVSRASGITKPKARAGSEP